MVDPNRKINRLTEQDLEFLDACEEEFENRFTEDDEQYVAFCSTSLPDPPIVDNWNTNAGGGGRDGGGSNYRSNNNGGRYRNSQYGSNNRNTWNKRDNTGHYNHSVGGGQPYRNQHFRREYKPYNNYNNNNNNNNNNKYNRSYRGGRSSVENNNNQFGESRKRSSYESQSQYTPMKIQKGYGNFVSATKTSDNDAQ